ncbi:PREDICTED: amiloride-sensitive sodium channel subunit gamma-like [Priapulus caudatus]|uniref:Amiloride-sensitive sodium channel subunit gamma-like n=1 Tax=Priapulus caudatus TaxID=37621 RepID=A0ABM1EA64_PRICU|nr:PREDICTED: amiloride-sensitive sodium channel subunit gamma-like [Priapulus caudatus]
MTVGEIVTAFTSSTTAHGVKRACGSRSLPARAAWAAITLCALAFLAYQHSLVVRRYFSYTVTVKVEMEYSRLPFPAVTICNKNPVRMSRLPSHVVNLVTSGYGNVLHTHESAFDEFRRIVSGNESQTTEGSQATATPPMSLKGIV